MLHILLALLAAGGAVAYGTTMVGDAAPKNAANSRASLYDLSFTAINGDTISLSTFKGKKILLVNVASRCGFTSQYADLQKLHEQYKDRLAIIGFPANDFAGQEPGSDEEIAQFCSVNYGVTFPLAKKSHVIGKEINPVFRWLSDKNLNGWNDAAPKWNFNKYLVSENGELLRVFPAATKPMSKEILELLK